MDNARGGAGPAGDRPRAGTGRPAGLTVERLAVVYQRLAPDVHRFLARRTSGVDVATELLSETFTRAVADRERFRGTTDTEVMAWIYTIARHQLIDHQRRERVEREALRRLGMQRRETGTEEYEEVERAFDLDGLRADVRAAIGELPETQRDAVRLRILEERSYDEVAHTLGISEQTARARVSRALRAMRDDPTLGDDAFPRRGRRSGKGGA